LSPKAAKSTAREKAWMTESSNGKAVSIGAGEPIGRVGDLDTEVLLKRKFVRVYLPTSGIPHPPQILSGLSGRHTPPS